jgi:hypothetical protein
METDSTTTEITIRAQIPLLQEITRTVKNPNVGKKETRAGLETATGETIAESPKRMIGESALILETEINIILETSLKAITIPKLPKAQKMAMKNRKHSLCVFIMAAKDVLSATLGEILVQKTSRGACLLAFTAGPGAKI